MTADRSGDEPALGGRDDDLSPMISSVQTRAIADARGAYVTGNLKALVSLMSKPQQRDFHIAMVRYAQSLARQMLAEPGAPPLPEAQSVLDAADRWLETPTRANGDALIAALETDSLITCSSFHDVPFYLSSALPGNGSESAPAVVLQRMLSVMVATPENAARMGMWGIGTREWESQRWLVEAAWQILHGRKPQPFNHTPSSGIERNYLSGRLDDLVQRMNALQRLRFRQALMRQLVRHIPPIPLRDQKLVQAWQALRDAAYEWSQQQSPDDSAIRAAAVRVDRIIDSKKTVPNPVGSGKLSRTFYKVSYATEVIRQATGWEAEKTAQIIAQELVGLGWAMEQVHERSALRWWQVEAAWAILHSEALPPLEGV
jgi:hypothetical protein